MHLLLAGVVLGILCAHIAESWHNFGYVTLTLGFLMIARACVVPSVTREHNLWKQAAIVTCGCTAGVFLSTYYLGVYEMKRDRVLNCASNCSFHAMIVTRPELVERGYRYEVKLLSMNDETLASTYAVVTIPATYTFLYGDTLSFSATVSPLRAFQSDTGRIVQYDKLMQSKNIHVKMEVSDIQYTGYVSSITRLSVQITDKCIEALKVALPEPVSGLAQGVTYGVRGALDEESETLFRVTGLSHITVFSGSNVAIVLAAVWFLTGAFPYAARVLFSLCILFVVLVGVGITPPTLRAGIMGALYVISRAIGKSTSGLHLLSISIVCMLLFQPDSLLYDLSFQLSVLAVGALMTIAIPIELQLQKHVPRSIAALAAMTGSVMLSVAPWTAYMFGTFSPSSFIANMLVVPLVPLALMFALLCAGVALSIPVLTPVVAYPTEILFTCIFKIAEASAALPYSSIDLPVFHGLYVCIWYGVLAVWYMSTQQKNAVSLGDAGLDH